MLAIEDVKAEKNDGEGKVQNYFARRRKVGMYFSFHDRMWHNYDDSGYHEDDAGLMEAFSCYFPDPSIRFNPLRARVLRGSLKAYDIQDRENTTEYKNRVHLVWRMRLVTIGAWFGKELPEVHAHAAKMITRFFRSIVISRRAKRFIFFGL